MSSASVYGSPRRWVSRPLRSTPGGRRVGQSGCVHEAAVARIVQHVATVDLTVGGRRAQLDVLDHPVRAQIGAVRAGGCGGRPAAGTRPRSARRRAGASSSRASRRAAAAARPPSRCARSPGAPPGRPPATGPCAAARRPPACRPDRCSWRTSGSTPASCWTAVGGASAGERVAVGQLARVEPADLALDLVGGVGDQAVVERLGLHGLHGLGDQIAVDAGLGLGDRRAERAVHRLRRRDPGDGVRLDRVGVQQQHLQHALRARRAGLASASRWTNAWSVSSTSGSASVRVFLPVRKLFSSPPRRRRRAGAPHRRSAAGPARRRRRRECARPRTSASGRGRSRCARAARAAPRRCRGSSGSASSSGPVHHRRHRADRVLPHPAPADARNGTSRSRRSRRAAAARSASVATIGSTPYGWRPSRSAGSGPRPRTWPTQWSRTASSDGLSSRLSPFARPAGVSCSIASPQVVVQSAVLKAAARACSRRPRPAASVAGSAGSMPSARRGHRARWPRRRAGLSRPRASAARAACAGSTPSGRSRCCWSACPAARTRRRR